MDHLKDTIESLQAAFNTRMTAFEEELKKNPSKTSTTISSDYQQFRSFVVASLTALQKQVDMLAAELDSMETRSRRKMLLLHGVPEHKEEDTVACVVDIVQKHLPNASLQSEDVRRAHRMGRLSASEDKPRPILIKFVGRQLRDDVWMSKVGLKQTGFTLSEFLTRRRHKLFMAARKKLGVSNCWTREGRIIAMSNGKRHSIASLKDLEKLESGSSSAPESLDVDSGAVVHPTIQETLSPTVLSDSDESKSLSGGRSVRASRAQAIPPKRTKIAAAAKK